MQQDNTEAALSRSASGSTTIVHSSSLTKKFAQGLIVQVNPQTKQIVGAINQAKKEQQEGTFDNDRQKGFIKFLDTHPDLVETNFPPSVWTDLFSILEGVINTICIVTQVKNITPSHTAMHVSIIRLMFKLLTADPGKIKFLNLHQEAYLEALAVSRLIQSQNRETVILGVNFCMLLVHHAEDCTLLDLLKFDTSSKDIIMKHESIKVWNAINSVNEQVSKQLIQGMAELDEKLESEQEAFETKISKQILGFVSSKMSGVDDKMEIQNASIQKQENGLKAFDTVFKSDMAKIQRQISDLGKGKITTAEELAEVGIKQSLVDLQQDEAMKQIKDDMEVKIVALQKELKKVKMSQGAVSPTSGLAGIMARQASGGGPDFLNRLNSGFGLQGGASVVDTSQLERQLDEHAREIDQLNEKFDSYLADKPGKSQNVKMAAVATTATRQENGSDSTHLKSEFEKQLKAMEDRVRKGFQKMKVEQDKIKEDVKKVGQDGSQAKVAVTGTSDNQEALEAVKTTKTSLVSLQDQFKAFQTETKSTLEQLKSAPSPAKPEVVEGTVPQKSAPSEQNAALITEMKTMVDKLEERVKKGFGKVKEDQGKIKVDLIAAKSVQEDQIPKVEKCLGDIEVITKKVESFQAEAKAAMDTLKADTETAQTEAKTTLETLRTETQAAQTEVNAALETLKTETQTAQTESKAALETLKAKTEAAQTESKATIEQLKSAPSPAKPEVVEGTVPQKSAQSEQNAALITEMKTMVDKLEERVKKGFGKVKEDQGKIKVDLIAAKSVQEDQIPKVEKLIVDLTALMMQLEEFRAEAKTSLEEAKSSVPTGLKDDIENLKKAQENQASLKEDIENFKKAQQSKAPAQTQKETSPIPASMDQQQATSSEIESLKASFTEELAKLKKESEEMKTQMGDLSSSDATQTSSIEGLDKKLDEMASKESDFAAQINTQVSSLETALQEQKTKSEDNLISLTERLEEFKKEASVKQLASEEKVIEIEQRLDKKLLDLTADADAEKLQTQTSAVVNEAAVKESELKEEIKEEKPKTAVYDENELSGRVSGITARLVALETDLRGNLEQMIKIEVEKLRQEAPVRPVETNTEQVPQSAPIETKKAREDTTGEELAALRAQIDQIMAKSELLEEKIRTETADLEIKFNQLRKEMETKNVAEAAPAQQLPVDNSATSEETAKKVSDLEAKVVDQSATVEALKGSFEELKTAVATQGSQEVAPGGASSQDLEQLKGKLAQLDEATKEAKQQISDLDEKTQTAIAAIASKPADQDVPQPPSSSQAQPQGDGDASSVAAIQELRAKLDETVREQKERTDKMEKMLTDQLETIKTKLKEQEEEDLVEEIKTVDDKLDAHIEEIKTKMEKQGKLFKTMMEKIKVISDKQDGKKVEDATDPDSAQQPAQAVAAAGIDPDEHFELKDKVESMSQEFSNFSKTIAEINKKLKRSEEQSNQKISTTELQALREEFENLTHDLRNQMLGIETTQKGVLTSFEEFKVCTDADIKALEEKSHQEISEGLSEVKEAQKTFLAISAFEAFQENSKAGSQSQKKETGEMLHKLEEKLVEVRQALTAKTGEKLTQLRHNLEELVEKSTASVEKKAKELQESFEKQSNELTSTMSEELKRLEQNQETQAKEIKSSLDKELKVFGDSQEKQLSDLNEKDEQLNLRQTEFEQDLGRQLQEIDNIKTQMEERSQADAEQFQSVDKKFRGLHKKIKGDQEDSFGKIKAELGLIVSDQKVTNETLTQHARYLDRIRCSNTYGEPLVNFNQDSATKTEMQEYVKEEVTKVMRKLKDVKKSTQIAEPLIQDLQEDTNMLKNMMKKQQEKMDEVKVVAEMKGGAKSQQVSPRGGAGSEQMDNTKLKRILQLIENNSQAMALQRETFSNLMVRIQMLEKTVGKRAGYVKSHSAIRSEPPIELSKNNYSSLTGKGGNESTDASFTRILPPPLETRKGSQNRHETPMSRNVSNPRTVELPKSLKAAHAVNDSEMGLYEVSPTKRSQIRANLYGGTPNGRSEIPGGTSAIKAKRFSHQMPSLKSPGESMMSPNKGSKDFKL